MRSSLIFVALASSLAAGTVSGSDLAQADRSPGLAELAQADPPMPECAGIPRVSLSNPLYDYRGLSGSFAGTLPAAPGQPVYIAFRVVSMEEQVARGAYNGWFMQPSGLLPRSGDFLAVIGPNPAGYPALHLVTPTGEWDPNYVVFGVRYMPGSRVITGLCLYDVKNPWPPTVFPYRPFALRRIMP